MVQFDLCSNLISIPLTRQHKEYRDADSGLMSDDEA